MPQLTTLGNETITVGDDAIAALRDSLSGNLLTSESAEYDEARSVWNAMIDRRPGLIVVCRGEGDVARAVTFAREHGVLLSVCGAGHNITGNAVCNGGLMISFKNMNTVDVDPTSRTVSG